MSARFLVDVNLPRCFSVWNNDLYIHQYDLGDDKTDSEIWVYAKTHSLSIITKDSDFSTKILLHTPPPRVIHIRIGNMRMRAFHELISGVWPTVLNLNEKYKLVNVFQDRIEGVM